MTRNGQAGPHGSLRIRRNQRQASSSCFAINNRIPYVDLESVEFFCVVQAVPIVADTTDKRGSTAQLRQTDNGVCNRPTADQSQFLVSLGKLR